MHNSSDDLLEDIDATLDQLIENAQALKSLRMAHCFEHETEALERTQESLLARILHRQSLLEMDEKKKTLESIRKEVLVRKVVEYTKVLKTRRSQKRAKARKARSKSSG